MALREVLIFETRYIKEVLSQQRPGFPGRSALEGLLSAGAVAYGDRFGDTAPGVPLGSDGHPSRFAGFYQVVENPVGYVLVEDSGIAEFKEVVFEGLQLDTASVGHVADGDRAEVRQAGLGTDRGEFGVDNLDGVVPAGIGVVEDFDDLFFHDSRRVGYVRESFIAAAK